jgi:hypothetical protein
LKAVIEKAELKVMYMITLQSCKSFKINGKDGFCCAGQATACASWAARFLNVSSSCRQAAQLEPSR